MDSLVDQLVKVVDRLASIEGRVVITETGVKKLERLTTEGNGQPSILAQLATIHAKVHQMQLTLDELTNNDAEAARVRYQGNIAVLCAIIAAIAAVVAAVWAH